MVGVTAETWNPGAGGRLRGVLIFVPAYLFCISYVLWLLVLTLVAPRYVQRQRHVLLHIWGSVLLWLIGVRIESRGMERLTRPGPAIVTFNHQSLLDLMLLTKLWPENATVLYKQEFHRIPVFGTCMRRLGMIPVDRRRRESAARSLAAAGRRLRDEGMKVLIAPEGTRSRTDGLLPFKRGPFHLALETGIPVLPVVFRGVRKIWPHGSLIPRPGVIAVDVLEPLDTSSWSAQTSQQHMDDLRGLYLEYVPGATIPQAQPRARSRS